MAKLKYLDLRKAVIDTCLKMNEEGINQGTSGNVSVRTPEGFLITASGIPYGRMKPEHIVEMDLDGGYVGGPGLGRAHLGDGTQAEARHAVQLHHDVGAHLAAAGEADGDGSPRFGAGLQFGNEGGDACDHFFFTPFLAADFFGTSRRTRPVTEGASVFLNSPDCLP